jgi:hypothetical protein
VRMYAHVCMCVCARYVTKSGLQLQAKLIKVMKFFFSLRPGKGPKKNRAFLTIKSGPKKYLK